MKTKRSIRELIVRDGSYINAYNKNQPTLLGMVDAKGWKDNKQTRESAKIARMKALKKAIIFQKKGWKDLSIYPHYSYGYPNPYRYDIEAWSSFDDKKSEFRFKTKGSGELSLRAKSIRGAIKSAKNWEKWLTKTGRGKEKVLIKSVYTVV